MSKTPNTYTFYISNMYVYYPLNCLNFKPFKGRCCCENNAPLNLWLSIHFFNNKFYKPTKTIHALFSSYLKDKIDVFGMGDLSYGN